MLLYYSSSKGIYMSHFCVLVIGEDIESQLAPFAEQDFSEEYGVFCDKEDDFLDEYQNKTTQIVVLADGSMHHQYSSQFRQYSNFNTEYVYPEGSIIREGHFTEMYDTLEAFAEGWHGYSERDKKMGRFGYWHNPQAKWDWWTLGGRFTGYFKPKAGASGEVGEPGAMNNKPTDGWVDSLLLKDVDLESMLQESIEQAHKTYDKIDHILKGREYPSWQAILEKHGEDNIDEAKLEFNQHPVVKDFNKAQFFIWGDFHETFGHSREEYVQKRKNSTMVPFAVIKDGQWYQKGEMGWFGFSTKEMTEKQWNNHFWELINALSPETRLSIVDCHI